ncbi:hypothetical protein [[Clostridium] dakarense]|uniref:hypothetical protein n=1 Tax=Faecalimicrobium dakarense TaxID=1301100 RepID=UPI0004AF9402|nr:hypothetical protein [[Clostridium] dakarense]
MNEIEVFMELLDEKSIDYILSEFFLDKNSKQNKLLKKIKLQKLLREPTISKMNKKYKIKGSSPIQSVKMGLADKDLINCNKDNFIDILISGEKFKLSNIEQFCTAYIKFPEIIQKNLEIIIENNKNGDFLFKGINDFKVSKPMDYLELKKLQKDIEVLKMIIEKNKIEVSKIKNENNRLYNENKRLNNENKELKNIIKKMKRTFVCLKKKV